MKRPVCFCNCLLLLVLWWLCLGASVATFVVGWIIFQKNNGHVGSILICRLCTQFSSNIFKMAALWSHRCAILICHPFYCCTSRCVVLGLSAFWFSFIYFIILFKLSSVGLITRGRGRGFCLCRVLRLDLITEMTGGLTCLYHKGPTHIYKRGIYTWGYTLS